MGDPDQTSDTSSPNGGTESSALHHMITLI